MHLITFYIDLIDICTQLYGALETLLSYPFMCPPLKQSHKFHLFAIINLYRLQSTYGVTPHKRHPYKEYSRSLGKSWEKLKTRPLQVLTPSFRPTFTMHTKGLTLQSGNLCLIRDAIVIKISLLYSLLTMEHFIETSPPYWHGALLQCSDSVFNIP